MKQKHPQRIRLHYLLQTTPGWERYYAGLHVLIIAVMMLFTNVQHVSADYTIGEEVCVQWDVDWRWYEAQVIETSSDSIKVHYPEYGSAWDEWVNADEVNVRYSFNVGDAVWVEWNLGFYTATVLQSSSDQYQVHYDGYDSSWDEWVNPCRVFPLPKVGDPVWVKWQSDWYYAKVLETGTNQWKIHYENYDSSWDEYVDPTRIMVCTPAQAAKAESGGSSTQVALVPSGANSYTYTAVTSPVVDIEASKAKPVGVGKVFRGGNTLSLAIELPEYAAGVDIYFGFTHESIPDIYFLGSDNTFHPLSTSIVAMATNTTGPVAKTLTQDSPVSGLPFTTGRYSLYLLVMPTGGNFTNYNLWYTEFTLSENGIFTGNTRLNAMSVQSLIKPFMDDMVVKGNASWYASVEQFISEYTDGEGNSNPTEARDVFIWAAYLQNNVYPFCWGALKAVEAEPTNPFALNNAAVCLLELGETDEAGRILDYAHYQDSTLSLTYENVAAYFDQLGDTARAAAEKLNALDGDFSWVHDAWDGYHYAESNGLSTFSAAFDSRIPLNYSLLKSNGTKGAGPATTRVCCSCNGNFYDDVVTCVDECTVTLACFTSICTPRLHCCWQKTPFGLESGICYPPSGLQVCVEASNTGNYTVKLGGKLGGIFGTYVGFSTNFKGNYNVAFSFSGSSGAKASVTLLTSDPNTQTGAAQFSWNPSTSVMGGVGFGANLEASNWPKSPICELNPP